MKRLWLAVALVLFGCEGRSRFASPREELEYLSSLSNPTPEQFRRRKELAERVGRADAALDRAIDRAVREQDLKRKHRADQEEESRRKDEAIRLYRQAERLEETDKAAAVERYEAIMLRYRDQAIVRHATARRNRLAEELGLPK